MMDWSFSRCNLLAVSVASRTRRPTSLFLDAVARLYDAMSDLFKSKAPLSPPEEDDEELPSVLAEDGDVEA